MSEDWKAKVIHIATRIVNAFKFYTDFIDLDDEGFEKCLLEKIEEKVKANEILRMSYVQLYKEIKKILNDYVKKNSKAN